MELVGFVNKQFNPYETFDVPHILTSYALCVHPSYRGLGVATEMLKARIEMLKFHGLKVTSTIFSTLGAQIAAKKANFEESWPMTYDDVTKMFPSFDFSNVSTKFLKKYSLKVE